MEAKPFTNTGESHLFLMLFSCHGFIDGIICSILSYKKTWFQHILESGYQIQAGEEGNVMPHPHLWTPHSLLY